MDLRLFLNRTILRVYNLHTAQIARSIANGFYVHKALSHSAAGIRHSILRSD